jgi:hypothetical protein
LHSFEDISLEGIIEKALVLFLRLWWSLFNWCLGRGCSWLSNHEDSWMIELLRLWSFMHQDDTWLAIVEIRLKTWISIHLAVVELRL